MEVLSSPTPPITLSPRASRSPLLARRSSRQAVPILDHTPSASSSTSPSPSPSHTFNLVPTQLASSSHLNFVLTPGSTTSVSSHTMVQPPGPNSASTSFTPSTSSSTTTATVTLRAPRRVNSNKHHASAGVMGFLPFIPLTPIMASPMLTPEPGASTGVDGGGVAGHEEGQRRFRQSVGTSGSLSPDVDYLGVHAKASAGPSSKPFGMRHPGAAVDSHNTGNPDAHVPNAGFPTSSSSSSSIKQRRLVTPSWISTPPTPPHSVCMRARTLSNPGENVSIADGFLTQRRSRLSQPRPASVAVFPDATTHSHSSSSSTSYFAISTERYSMRPTEADAATRAETLGANTNAYTQPKKQVKRRQSLPPNFWKPLPPIPHPPHSSHTHSTTALTRPRSRYSLHSKRSLGDIQRHRSSSIPRSPISSLTPHYYMVPMDMAAGVDVDGGDNNVLSPSLSRVPKGLHRRRSSPLRTGIIASEAPDHYSNSNEGLRESTSAGSSYKSALSSPAFPSPDPQSPRTSRDSAGKRLFHLHADDEDADEDSGGKLSRESSLQGESSSQDGRNAVDTGMSAVKSKRYHAILELLTTEFGYLVDLKTLVSVYLAQLEALSIPIPSPSPSRPSPSSLSISGLTRSFPSRSHLAAHPPSITNAAFGLGPPEADDRGSSRPASPEFGGRGSSRETKVPSRRPILTESELASVRRNAEELVTFHERFIGILKSALEPLGFASLLDGDTSFSGDVDSIDEVVRVVAEAFVKRQDYLAPYTVSQ
ncbi:hypothetical protein QCA50_000819 [Cerrena zonata]|uniref:DH domain-containing protein n=1 Tax=Cerrena zonata TaxID=2478898 RepID=A0AAW0GYK9_9APHY